MGVTAFYSARAGGEPASLKSLAVFGFTEARRPAVSLLVFSVTD